MHFYVYIHIYVFQASDGDLGENGTVEYIVDSGQSVPFHVMLVSGIIYTTEEFVLTPLNLLQYQFTITARDRGVPPLSTSTRVIVSASDVCLMLLNVC